jgi:hypothetical protein
MTTGKMYERVAVKLSDAQVLVLGKEHAAKDAEHRKVTEEKGEALNTFNAKLKTLEAEMHDISDQVNNQEKEVDIEVREEPDYGRNTVVTVRVDNGQPLKTRPMTLNEMAEGKHRATSDEPGESDADAPAEAAPKGRRSKRAKASESDEAVEDVGAVE